MNSFGNLTYIFKMETTSTHFLSEKERKKWNSFGKCINCNVICVQQIKKRNVCLQRFHFSDRIREVKFIEILAFINFGILFSVRKCNTIFKYIWMKEKNPSFVKRVCYVQRILIQITHFPRRQNQWCLIGKSANNVATVTALKSTKIRWNRDSSMSTA